jgi:hypothetical protein
MVNLEKELVVEIYNDNNYRVLMKFRTMYCTERTPKYSIEVVNKN